MLIEKLEEHHFDLAKARLDTLKVLEEYEAPGGQIALTHRPDAVTSKDKLYGATGSLYDFENDEFTDTEQSFTVFNDAFKDTYLYEIYKSFPSIGRFRIMVMDGPKAYTVHRDFTKRIHLVLFSDPRCYFVFPDVSRIEHLPPSESPYMVDTTQTHTFLNGSRERRIHLVMDDISTYVRD